MPRVPLEAEGGLNRELWVVPAAFVSWIFRFRFLELIWAIKVCRGFDPPFPPKRGVQEELQDRRATPPAAQPGPICG